MRKNLSMMTAVFVLCLLSTGGAIVPNGTAAETITIASGEWSPYLSKNLKHNGIAGRIITDIFAGEGIAVKFNFLPWKKAYLDTEKGKFDGTAVWLKKPEREQTFWFTDDVITETHVFFFKKGRAFDWNTPKDLESYRLGGLLGFSYGPELDRAINDGKIRVDRIVKDEVNFKKLLIGRIDLYPQELNVSYELLHRQFSADDIALIAHHPKPLMENPSYLLLPKSRPGSLRLKTLFNKGLAEFKKNGTVDRYIAEGRQGKYSVR